MHEIDNTYFSALADRIFQTTFSEIEQFIEYTQRYISIKILSPSNSWSIFRGTFLKLVILASKFYHLSQKTCMDYERQLTLRFHLAKTKLKHRYPSKRRRKASFI